MKYVRLISALWALFYCPVVFASGTIPFSLAQRLDQFGKPLAGCRLYIIQAGTTSTPQNAYQDAALTLPTANPIICDSSGSLPQFFLADGTIKVRLTDKNGVNQLTADGIQVIGPSGGGGGGGGSVDPTSVLVTGQIIFKYGTGVQPGFVRPNGRTIGSATSGATERANADVQGLFEHLWQNDATLPVSSGRGASSLADWVANKTIGLPDMRGRVAAGADDMGNSPAGRLTPAASACDATNLGKSCGSQQQTIQSFHLPNYALSVSASGSASVSATTANWFRGASITQIFGAGAGTAVDAITFGTGSLSAPASNGTSSVTGSTSSINGNQTQLGLNMVQPTMIFTPYMKL